jgi:DNA phosphorothioation-associated putative methyltransferase
VELAHADVVNLGYVLNVIESPEERKEALETAFRLARQLLVVSVLTSHAVAAPGSQEYGDGSITTRGTFQKYFSQEEAKEWIEEYLGKEAMAVGPGLFFVFSDEIEEQRFLANRRRKKRDIGHLLAMKPPAPGAKTWADWIAFDSQKESLSKLWEQMLELGRLPAQDELVPELSSWIENEAGSVRQAARLAQVGFEPGEFNDARASRIDDLSVYFALNLFNRRQPYTQLPQELQRDVTVFFSSYRAAEESGRELLFSVGDTEVIHQACVGSAERGIGFLDGTHSLQVHAGLSDQLPPQLRAYIGCAEKLYGDIEQADLVKIHIRSGKVTFLEYDSFDKTPLPQLATRVKVNLREQSVEYFHYDNDPEPPFLYLKSRYMEAGQTGYEKQKRFDRKLERLDLFDLNGFGPRATEFSKALSREGLCLNGWSLSKA